MRCDRQSLRILLWTCVLVVALILVSVISNAPVAHAHDAVGEAGPDGLLIRDVQLTRDIDCTDPNEPNNDWSMATAISYGFAVTGVDICPEGDKDYYAFAGSAGDYIRISIEQTNWVDDFVPAIRLFDTDGVTQLVAHQPFGSLTYELPASGTYYISVEAFMVGGSEYQYWLTLEHIACDDIFEPNDTAGDAHVIEYETELDPAPLICPTDDVDYYAFEGMANDYIRVYTDWQSLSVTLLDTDGTTELIHEEGWYVSLEYPLETDGTYFVRIESYSGEGGEDFHYLLGLESISCEDVFEPNDTPETAFEIVGGATVEYGAICPKGDIDYYKISASGDDYARIHFWDPWSWFAGRLTVLRPDGVSALHIQDYFGDALVELTEDETFYIKVENYSDEGGPDNLYSVQVNPFSCTDPHEPNDEFSNATPIAYDSVTENTDICPSNDYDYYSFAGNGGDIITADVDAWEIGSDLDAALCLYNANQDELGCNYDDNGPDPRLQYELPSTGTYYLRVWNDYWWDYVDLDYNYTLRLDRAPIAKSEIWPNVIEQTVELGESATMTLAIASMGDGNLTFDIYEIPGSPRAVAAKTLEFHVPAIVSELSVERDGRNLSPQDLPLGSVVAEAKTIRIAEERVAGTEFEVLVVTEEEEWHAAWLLAVLNSYPDVRAELWNRADDVPKPRDLEPYCVVMVDRAWYDWSTGRNLGDSLADYIDAGGKVIESMPEWEEYVAGRYRAEKYSPFFEPPEWRTYYEADRMDLLVGPHPVMDGVNKVDDYYYHFNPQLAAGAILLADWQYSGQHYVAVNDNVVALNQRLLSPGYWTGDVGTMLHNSIEWLCGEPSDVPWLSVSPMSGEVAPTETQTVNITVDTSSGAISDAGHHTATLVIYTNDRDNPVTQIMVEMDVVSADHSVYLPMIEADTQNIR